MEDVIELLKDYQTFQKQGHKGDFLHFGEWLKQKYAPKETYLTNEEEVNEAGLDVMASYLIGGLSNYVEVWVKLTYQDLPLNSLGDFGIMKIVEFAKNPTKKVIVENSVMERTTCIESIKRLTKEGLFAETIDPKDRRKRRVSLTAKGEEMIELLNVRMMALGKLLSGNLDELEKKSLLPILNKLIDFHDQLYRQKDRQAIKEQFGL